MKKKISPVRAKSADAVTAGGQPKVLDRASVKICRMALVGIVIAVVMITAVVITTLANSMTAITNKAFEGIAHGNATQVREVLGSADTAATLLQDYLTNSFLAEATTGGGAVTRASQIYPDVKLGTFAYERESVLLNTMWSTMAGNDSILSMAALFEKNAFARNVKDYSVYLTPEDAASRTARTAGEYDTFSGYSYYSTCAQTRAVYARSIHKCKRCDQYRDRLSAGRQRPLQGCCGCRVGSEPFGGDHFHGGGLRIHDGGCYDAGSYRGL